MGAPEPVKETISTDLLPRYLAVRKLTEQHCKPLQTEDYIPQIEEYASPPLWHLAHTTWFFEEMILKRFVPGYQEFNPRFSYLFNSYYEAVGPRHARHQRGVITRPGVADVYCYRAAVDEAMQRLLSTSPQQRSSALNDLITLGLHHEQQHQELLLTDLKLAFSCNPMLPVYDAHWREHTRPVENSDWVSIEEGLYTVGYQGTGFCYDNERSAHLTYVQTCQLRQQLVSNAEYCAFIEDGGYQTASLWLSEGWDWCRAQQAKAPLYWQQQKDGRWFQFTLAGLKPVEVNAPVAHVNFYEASAFAAWRGQRLPTEFEWEVACSQLEWGQRWEWTQSAYLPYPGFTVSEGAVGEYNGKFMVNQMVLRGASVATSPHHSRPSYRNFFHPHLQWQMTGIRLAQ